MTRPPDAPLVIPEPFQDFRSCPEWMEGGNCNEWTRALSAWLREATARISEAFDAGLEIERLVHSRAAVLDRLLIAAWHRFRLDEAADMALVAVGGYGRGELHPGSDVDLLILHRNLLDTSATERVSALITLLWDVGLQVGHSVRTPDECIAEAESDVRTATNLMEARRLAGSADLFSDMMAHTAPPVLWPAAWFFSAKLAEQAARHRHFGGTAYRLEPNLKEGPGGLRDIQTIGWVTRRHFGSASLHEVVAHGFLTEDEYRTLIDGQSFLWRVRFALHLAAGRKEDRLLFDHQRALARRFGFSDRENALDVEQFMQQYFRTVMELERLNEMLLQLYQEALLSAPGGEAVVTINRRFQARHGFLEARHPQVFEHYPPALLEVFLILAQHTELKGIRAETIRLIRRNRRRIDEHFRNDLVCRSLFMEILRQPRNVTTALRRMNRYGVLAAYLPEFAVIVGRMQYDLFHAYTVDEHTLFVIRNLRRLALREHEHEEPELSHLFRQVSKPELLYLAALFHDIAKGRGGDHSTLGAEDARRFCLRHGLSQYDANLVAWLVKGHLLMSLTAQRKDISDPDVVMEFASQVGNATRLDHLYLLTFADICGTNPDLWNSWRAALLAMLHADTQRMLRRGLDNPPDQDELVGETQTAALALLIAHGVREADCQSRWETLEPEYFLRHSADEIAWHTRAILRAAPDDLPLILVRQETERGGTEVFLYAEDRPHLFALATTALARIGLDIVDARIISTSDGNTLNTYLVLEETGQPILDPARADEIGRALRHLMLTPPSRIRPPHRSTPRALRHFDVPARVEFGAADRYGQSVLSVSAADRPGLLSRIGIALFENGVRVHNARIATAGLRADDIFYITAFDDSPITDPSRRQAIREAVEAAIAEEPA